MLIDKDKTIQAIATYLFVNDAIRGPEPKKVRDYLVFAESMLKDVPDLNVVRCKECVFRNQKYLCQVIETDDDDFCSYGERSE